MKECIDAIRVETALSRYPMHRLAKAGSVKLVIREENAVGDLFRWEVSYNSKYGQTGPLAYKLDTLIVNRRIEAAGKPVPEMISLGSLNDICRELGLVDSGKNKANIKRALYQNASAFVSAKIKYRTVNGGRKSIEFGDTRYAIVFTGEELPDGRQADSIYLLLHKSYKEIIETSVTRPLDYEYLKTMPPTPQRLYELLSYQMYAALKNRHSSARLLYSEFCLYAPQTRYFNYEQVKKQLYKLHAPHRKSGYINSVEFENATDRQGKPDWWMIYIPGPKAENEYRAFTRRKAID